MNGNIRQMESKMSMSEILLQCLIGLGAGTSSLVYWLHPVDNINYTRCQGIGI